MTPAFYRGVRNGLLLAIPLWALLLGAAWVVAR